MTIKEAVKKYQTVEIDLLLSHLLGKSREFLLMNPEVILLSYHVNILTKLVKRRLKGEPIAYIIGYKDFMGLRFKVNKNVLVPRPETEGLVERVYQVCKVFQVRGVIPSAAEESLNGHNISKVKGSLHSPSDAFGLGRDGKVKILDVGTGSGCIAIALAKLLPTIIHNSRFIIHASDLSPAALAVAKQNAKIHKVKIQFKHSNILQNIGMNFDIIIANLPYLPSEASAKEGGWKAWKNNTTAATIGLKFEPQNALFTEEKGLKLIRQLLEQIAARKNQPKLIYLEFDPRQKAELQKLIKKILPKSKAIFHKDLNNLWRFVEMKI